jgi:hypothetical protein
MHAEKDLPKDGYTRSECEIALAFGDYWTFCPTAGISAPVPRIDTQILTVTDRFGFLTSARQVPVFVIDELSQGHAAFAVLPFANLSGDPEQEYFPTA